MFDIIWHFIDISVPWEVKLAVAAVVLGVLLAFFRTYWKVILAAGAVVGGAILLNRAKQQGYAERQTDETQATKQAEVVVDTTKQQVHAAPDAQLNSEVDQWSQK